MFLQGLRTDGVPLKFSSWHTFIFSSGSAQNVNLLVQERSRSVKALFAVQRRPTTNYGFDSGATFFDTSNGGTQGGTLQNYQWRIGGRYFPGAPVQTSANGSRYSNGGAEAYVELSKALNIVGDYRLSTNANAKTWAVPPGSTPAFSQPYPAAGVGGVLLEYDYQFSQEFVAGSTAALRLQLLEQPQQQTKQNFFCGTTGSANFAMAINLEISNGIEISGLNAEEQSDIALIAQWFGPQVLGSVQPGPSNLEVYSFYDAMIVLRENNVLELIQ
jgi:hypothetical protein